ncbi:hypothetical protein AB0E82_14530 [Streptomyces anulatus]|uniref:hypothetical protein n=1 Tax=Streptomyces anulatus TaxID=1892 RepID=UPI0033E035C6
MDLRHGGWAQEADAELRPGTPASGVAFTAVARYGTELGEADVHGYGPVCTLPVPESLGFTFHGRWVHA